MCSGKPGKLVVYFSLHLKFWGTGEPVIQLLESKDSRARSSIVRNRWMPQLKQRERENLPFLCLLVSFRLLMDWIMPSTLVRVVLVTQSTELTANLFRTPSHTHSEILFYGLSGHLLAQSSWYTELTISRIKLNTWKSLDDTCTYPLTSFRADTFCSPLWSTTVLWGVPLWKFKKWPISILRKTFSVYLFS